MFDVSKFPVVPVSDVLTPFDAAPPSDVSARSASSLVDLEEQFRAVLKKLSYCGSTLGKLPENCSFTVCIELQDQANPPIGVGKYACSAFDRVAHSSQHPQPWIPSEPSLQTTSRNGSSTKGNDLGGVKSIPVRSVEAGDIAFEVWIEEGKGKQKL
jgi:mitotic spindle assembly checkpoint protein MAD2B